MIRDVIFDMDGTLVDSASINLRSVNSALAIHGLDQASEEAYRLAFSMKGEEALRYLGVPEDLVGPVRDTWFREIRKIRHESQLFPGLWDLAARLKGAGFQLGIITSRHSSELDFDVERLGLDRVFSTFVAADMVARPKPSRDSMDLYLARSGARLDQVFYIGDSLHDRDFAKNCGIPFGLALWGAQDKTLGADVAFSNAGEIWEYFSDL